MKTNCKDKIHGSSEPYKDLWQLAKEYSTVNICSHPANSAAGSFPSDYMVMPKPPPFPSTDAKAMCISKSQLSLSNQLRMLWEQHIIWTALTIISIVEDRPYKDLVVKRLLRNPKDFEVALKPFYGSKDAARFSDLLTQHLMIAADLVTASKAGNTKAAAEAEKKWYANADEIAKFLGSINPYWSEESWRKMLYEHLNLTKSEAVLRLNNENEKAINIYDDIERQALEMADMMSQGIVKQFPDMFR